MEPKERAETATSRRQSAPPSAKPKIRVVHVVAPEIIETDAANFREVVQRLTGKPGSGKTTATKKKRKRTNRRSRRPCATATVARDAAGKPGGGDTAAEEEEEGESWMEMELKSSGGSSSGSYVCREFEEIEGFLQELSEVPFPNLVE